MDKLTLADIETLAASGAYGGDISMWATSTALGLSAAAFLYNLDLWQGAGYELTANEIDRIHTYISQLENDLTLAGSQQNMSTCKVSLLASLSVVSGIGTTLQWDVELYDPNNMHTNLVNPARITAVEDGVHIINAFVEWSPAAIGYRKMLLRKQVFGGGVEWVAEQWIQDAQVATKLCNSLSVQDYAYEGDYYTVQVMQTSGANLNIEVGIFNPFFAVIRP